MVSCETQAEIDHFWNKLSEGGRPNRCGWLQDKFGISWQVIPSILSQLLQHKDKSKRVVAALAQMDKLDIAGSKKAYEEG
jgi:predicted 3-demethylubiquinone-9 3-methyltransferase (glyoxalase superfamily)